MKFNVNPENGLKAPQSLCRVDIVITNPCMPRAARLLTSSHAAPRPPA
ncbi:hypothetical protein PSP6_100164 [Paraburkholderia tropica]|nr:hypothetical protein PSP6_100164 [Paraburkholderia tropica]